MDFLSTFFPVILKEYAICIAFSVFVRRCKLGVQQSLPHLLYLVFLLQISKDFNFGF